MTQPIYPPPPAALPETMPPRAVTVSGFAIASLVLGIMGWFYAVPAVLAVIFGHIAYHKIKQSNGWKTGKGMAIAGFVLGYVWLAVFAVIFIAALAQDSNTGTTTYDKQPTSRYNPHAGSSDPLVPFGPGQSTPVQLPPMF